MDQDQTARTLRSEVSAWKLGLSRAHYIFALLTRTQIMNASDCRSGGGGSKQIRFCQTERV